MADTSVKFLHSGLNGAPVLSGTAGALKAVLDACLVDGWGAATVDSLTIASGIATVTRGAGHPFEVDSVVQVSGATTTGGSVNGEQRVLSVSGASYTFAAIGLPDQVATGAIEHKVAPLGWTREFSAGNVVAYRSGAGTRAYLRLDDSGTQDARVRAYVSMTDVNTGTGDSPSVAQQTGAGYFWAKSSTADATGRGWIVSGDGRTFYLSIQHHAAATTSYVTHVVGDALSVVVGDPYAFIVSGGGSSFSASSSFPFRGADVFSSLPATDHTLATLRAGSGLGTAVIGRLAAPHPIADGATSSNLSGEISNGHYVWPNSANGGLILCQIALHDPSSSLRGALRGIYYSPQRIGTSAFANRAFVGDLAGLPGRWLRSVNNGSGPGFIDGTGPWPYE